MPDWNESQAGIKTVRRNINNLRYADDTTLMAESEEELKSLLMRVNEESGKSWLETQHKKKTKQIGLPWWLSSKEFTSQCRRHRFDP